MNESKATRHGLEPEQEKRWAKIVARAWDDDEFRQRLLAQPGVVLREAGFDLPEDVEVEIVNQAPEEISEGVTCVELPGRPPADDLVEHDLSSPEDATSELGQGQ